MPLSPRARRSLDVLLSSAVQRSVVPGVAAVTADRVNETYRGACGARTAADPPAPEMTPDSVVWIASMTKLVVAVAVLTFVEQGELDLDAPVRELLPELANPLVLEGFDGAGEPILRAAATPITLRHLLSGTSGHGYGFLHGPLARYQRLRELPGILNCQLATLTSPLLFEPGTAWAYGMGMEWVGRALEALTGRSLEEVLRQRVLDPLGMNSMTFVLQEQHRQVLAQLSMRDPACGFVPLRFEVPQQPEFQSGGGGLYGSAADYLILLRMLLGRGKVDGLRLLSEQTVAEAARNQIPEHSIGRIPTQDPRSSEDIDFLPETQKGWCLLGMINMRPSHHGRSAGSLFWGGAGNTYFWVDWLNGDAGVMVTQLLPFADKQVVSLFEDLEQVVHAG